jgi:hypothetical protein
MCRGPSRSPRSDQDKRKAEQGKGQLRGRRTHHAEAPLSCGLLVQDVGGGRSSRSSCGEEPGPHRRQRLWVCIALTLRRARYVPESPQNGADTFLNPVSTRVTLKHWQRSTGQRPIGRASFLEIWKSASIPVKQPKLFQVLRTHALGFTAHGNLRGPSPCQSGKRHQVRVVSLFFTNFFRGFWAYFRLFATAYPGTQKRFKTLSY